VWVGGVVVPGSGFPQSWLKMMEFGKTGTPDQSATRALVVRLREQVVEQLAELRQAREQAERRFEVWQAEFQRELSALEGEATPVPVTARGPHSPQFSIWLKR
jgi:hypothetical protein